MKTFGTTKNLENYNKYALLEASRMLAEIYPTQPPKKTIWD